MSQLPEDPKPGSVPPPPPPPPSYGAGAFSPPVDASAAFGTPGPALLRDDELASRWLRLAGSLIDSVIVGVPSVVLAIAAGDTTAGAVTYLVYVALSVLYAPLLLMREGERNGQTIGKQAVGIRVRDESGEPLTLGRAALREIVGRTVLGLVTCGIYSLLDALWCLWDKRKQCLHDKIASTVVTRA